MSSALEQGMDDLILDFARVSSNPCSSLLIRTSQMITLLRRFWQLCKSGEILTGKLKRAMLPFGQNIIQSIGDAICRQFNQPAPRIDDLQSKPILVVRKISVTRQHNGDDTSFRARLELLEICLDEMSCSDPQSIGLDRALDLAWVMLKLSSLGETFLDMRIGGINKDVTMPPHHAARGPRIDAYLANIAFLTVAFLGRVQSCCVFPEVRTPVVLWNQTKGSQDRKRKTPKPKPLIRKIGKNKQQHGFAYYRKDDPEQCSQHERIVEQEEHLKSIRKLELDLENLPLPVEDSDTLTKHLDTARLVMLRARQARDAAGNMEILDTWIRELSKISLNAVRHLARMVDMMTINEELKGTDLRDDFEPSELTDDDYKCLSEFGLWSYLKVGDESELGDSEDASEPEREEEDGDVKNADEERDCGKEEEAVESDDEPEGRRDLDPEDWIEKPDMDEDSDPEEIRQWLVLSFLDELYRIPPDDPGRFDLAKIILGFCSGGRLNLEIPDEWSVSHGKTSRAGLSLPHVRLADPEVEADMCRITDLIQYRRWAIIALAQCHLENFDHEELVLWGRVVQPYRFTRHHWVWTGEKVALKSRSHPRWAVTPRFVDD